MMCITRGLGNCISLLVFFGIINGISQVRGNLDLYHSKLSNSFEQCDFEGPSLFCSSPILETDLQVCYFCTNGTATCDNIPNTGMICKNGHVYIHECYCATYNEQSNSIEFGQCIYNCPKKVTAEINTGYTKLPQNISELNSWMCGSLHRDGTLCGTCRDTYYPLAFSYNVSCMKCQKPQLNYLKLGLYTLIPLTVFCIIIMIFNINITSSYLHGYILFSQVISAPAMERVIMLVHRNNPKLTNYGSILFSIWNLDIMRGISPNICINDIVKIDLLLGLYPLVLIIITHFMIKLYDKKYRLLTLLWRPFHKLISLLHRYLKINTSTIDSFATILVLSNAKFMNVCFDGLAYVTVYQLTSSRIHHVDRAFYDASHKPYYNIHNIHHVIITLIVFVVFTIFPIILLLLYPLKCFHKFLNRTPVRWHALHTFVDVFQGGYKNGFDHGTKDYRLFSALFLIIRIFYFAIYGVTLSTVFFIYAAMVSVVVAILLIILQPFKREKDSYINTTFLMLLSLWYTGIVGIILAQSTSSQFVPFLTGFCYAVTILPVIFTSLLVAHWIYSHKVLNKT